jgi:hypothetical protein
MKTQAWTVRTPKGRIYPPWTFDNEEEATDFAARLNEKCYPHNHAAFPCEIILTPTTNQELPSNN